MVNLEKYEDIQDVPCGSNILFQEYTINPRNNKIQKSVEIRGNLQRIVDKSDKLSLEELQQYYPDIQDSEDFVSLSEYPYFRLVLIVGTNVVGIPIYKVVHINSYFLQTKLQRLQYEVQEQQVQTVPQNILGYESYQIGQKFKK